MRALSAVGFSILLMVTLSSAAPAQTLKGTILGSVVDASGGVVPGVQVTAVHVPTNRSFTAVTNEQGLYEISTLDIGEYRVSAELSGFKKVTVNHVILTIGQKERVDVKLEVGDINSVVEVTGKTPLLHTDEGTISKQLSGKEVKELPLLGRDITQLQLLAPGTTLGYAGGGNLGVALNVGVTTNGGKIVQGDNVTLDGGDNTNEGLYHAAMRPSVESVDEFRFQTGVYSAEYGRAPSNLAMVTKSGSNQFHGSGFWFFQDDSLNARSKLAATKGTLRLNQFGYTFGGPLIKDKLFFFTNFDEYRNITPVLYNTTVPSDALRSGDFSALNKIIKDPVTGQSFQGNIIPTNRIGPFGRTVMDTLLPKANQSGNIWNATASSNNSHHQFGGKLDYNLSDQDQIMGRYTIEYTLVGQDYIGQPILPQRYDLCFQNLVLGEVHRFNSRMLNDFRFTFHREAVPIVSPNPKNIDFLKTVGVGGLDPHNTGFPMIGMTGYPSTGSYGYGSLWFYNAFQVDDTSTMIRKNHSLKFGFSFRRFQGNQLRDNSSQGNFQFSGVITGDAFADMLLGYPTQVSWGPPAGALYDRFSYFNGFLQDDWKVTSRLSLGLGIRYDLFTRQKEIYNRLSTVDVNTGKIVVAGTQLPTNLEPRFVASFPAGTIVPASSIPGLPVDTLRGGDHNNFSPRISIAYRPFGNRTVIRGGYGVYYTLPDEFGNTEPSGRLGPWQGARTIISTKPDINITNPFANLAAPTLQLPSGRYQGGQEFRDGYVHQFSFSIEHEVLKDTVVEVGYVGNVGRKLEAIIGNYNNAQPGDPNTVQARRRYPNLGPISYEASVGTSDYNALQIRAERRYTRGLTISGSYTWGKAMFNTAQGPAANNVFDPLRLDAWRAPGNWDITHRVSAYWVWDVPVGRGRRFLNSGGVLDAVLGGWEFTGIANLQSGLPFNVMSSRAAVLSGTGTGIGMPADRIGNGELPQSERTQLRWFDTTAFKTPAPQTYGNAGLNILRASGQKRWDLGIYKNFRVREGHSIQFRSEFFNAFNHADWGSPTSDVDNANFGRIFSTTGPRAIQLALKYSF